MTITATTAHPAEVSKHFRDYADILDIYASDQVASLRMHRTQTDKKAANLRASVYREIAEEMRAIKFEK